MTDEASPARRLLRQAATALGIPREVIDVALSDQVRGIFRILEWALKIGIGILFLILMPRACAPIGDAASVQGAFTRAEFVTIILTALAVILAALTLFIAGGAFWGYSQIRLLASNMATKAAERIAEQVATATAKDVAETVATRTAQEAARLAFKDYAGDGDEIGRAAGEGKGDGDS